MSIAFNPFDPKETTWEALVELSPDTHRTWDTSQHFTKEDCKKALRELRRRVKYVRRLQSMS